MPSATPFQENQAPSCEGNSTCTEADLVPERCTLRYLSTQPGHIAAGTPVSVLF